MTTILTANMTELDAVNEMLLSIGESPVSTLTSGLDDAAQALTALQGASRQVQLEGWNANTRKGIALSKDASDIVGVPVNTLTVNTTSRIPNNKITRPALSGHLNISVRRSTDDTQFLLWDNDNDRETWPNEDTITVNLVQYLEFDNLPPSLQVYISKLAAHKFQKGSMASRVLSQMTKEEVFEAQDMAANDDEETGNANVLRDSPSAFAATYRRNPIYGS
jgi:hypothetical protein